MVLGKLFAAFAEAVASVVDPCDLDGEYEPGTGVDFDFAKNFINDL